jgi:hypothetical protein
MRQPGKNYRKILRARARKMFLQFFHNYSSFGASGLAWERIVEELWKYLVNPAPDVGI